MFFFGVILLVGVDILVVGSTTFLAAVNLVVSHGDTNGLLTLSFHVFPFPWVTWVVMPWVAGIFPWVDWVALPWYDLAGWVAELFYWVDWVSFP